VERWGESGCWESNKTLAKKLGVNRVNVIRSIKRLTRKGYLARLPDKGKTLYVNYEMFDEPIMAGGAAQLKSSAAPPKRVALRNPIKNIEKEINKGRRLNPATRAREVKRQKELLFK